MHKIIITLQKKGRGHDPVRPWPTPWPITFRISFFLAIVSYRKHKAYLMVDKCSNHIKFI